jgi:hypothetical protein
MFDSLLERIMGLILKKKSLAGETGVQGFSKSGEGFFFLMKTVGRSYPHRLLNENRGPVLPHRLNFLEKSTAGWCLISQANNGDVLCFSSQIGNETRRETTTIWNRHTSETQQHAGAQF